MKHYRITQGTSRTTVIALLVPACLTACLTALLTLVLGGANASAAAMPSGPHLAPHLVPHAAGKAPRVTFGLGPGGQAFADKRQFLAYAGAPGSMLVDKVAVYNQSNLPLDLLVYASDATNTPTGALDIRPRSQPNTGMGAWVALGAAATAGRPPADGRAVVKVHVPAQSRSRGIGRVLVPVSVIVPPDAVPGDHEAGIVAALVSTGKNPGSQNIELEQRVALKVYFRVAGDLRSGLAVKILKATYLAGSGLGLHGTTRVRYVVRNTGNIRIAAITKVEVRGLFGLGARSVVGPRLDELVPGGSAELTTDVRGTPPTIIQHAKVIVRAAAAPGNPSVRLATASSSVRLWAVVWQELVVVLLVLAVGLWLWRRRTRGPQPPRGRHAAQPRVEPKKAASAGVTVTLLALVVVATSGGRARAADLGPVGVKPRVGTNNTLFFGYLAHAKCPAGTTDSYWTVDGPDLPHDTAFLGQGNASGTGEQQFRGASIANVRTAYPDSFRRSGTYFVRFSCVPPDGKVRDSYQVPLLYRVAGRGSWQAQGAQQVPDYVLDPSVASPAPTSPSRPTAAPGGGPAPPASGPSATTSRSPGAVPSGPASAGQATGSATSAQGSGGGSGSSGGWWLGLLLLPALGVAAWALRRRGGR